MKNIVFVKERKEKHSVSIQNKDSHQRPIVSLSLSFVRLRKKEMSASDGRRT